MPCHPARRLSPSLVIAAGLFLGQAALAEEPGACPPPRPVTPRVAEPADLPSYVRADEADAQQDGVSEFRGHVEVTRGASRLQADRVTYDERTDITEASGNVVQQNEGGDSYRTQYLQRHGETGKGHTDAGTYTLQSNDARGDMQRVDFIDFDHSRLTKVRYTTCAPGQDDWFVHAPDIVVDNVEEMAYVRNAWVEFKGVPIFYMPRGAFSISDKRKSGFLTPSFGYTSNSGADITAPYYFNLAPNFDDTLTPRLLGSRGVQLQNEFRYLTRRSAGKLDLEFLPNDNVRDRDRYSGSYVHTHAFTPLWSANVDVRGVSDKDYLNDFGTNLNTTSTTHLPQNAEVNYRGPLWNFTARLSDHQTVDKTIALTDRPYARLPQLLLGVTTPARSEHLQYHFSSELVHFQRNVGITGNRLNLLPAVSYPMIRRYGFITPKVGARYIGYGLTGTDDGSPSVTGGFFSLDSGLFFERDLRGEKQDFIQTLEPRFYFLYVPRKNQDHLPNFDTGVPDFNFATLFRDQRFDGGDRIGDTKQATLALTSRLLDADNGSELARGGIGRAYYFADRQVNIPVGTTTATATANSDWLAEAAARLPGNWYISASGQFERQTHKTQKSGVYLQYNPGPNKIINIGQRFTRNELHQRDVSFEWPLAGRWTVRASAIDSLRNDREIESHAGLEYKTCCWAFRALLTRRNHNQDPLVTPVEKPIKGILFELELTGLTKYTRGGSYPESPLRQSMFGAPAANR